MTAVPSASLSRRVALWKPHFVAGVTLLFGFPGGILLASLNWFRMARTLKAVGHLAAGALGASIFMVLGLALPQELAASLVPALALLANTVILLYLLEGMHNDMERFASRSGDIHTAPWLVGCLVGLLPLVVLVGAVTSLAGA